MRINGAKQSFQVADITKGWIYEKTHALQATTHRTGKENTNNSKHYIKDRLYIGVSFNELRWLVL